MLVERRNGTLNARMLLRASLASGRLRLRLISEIGCHMLAPLGRLETGASVVSLPPPRCASPASEAGRLYWHDLYKDELCLRLGVVGVGEQRIVIAQPETRPKTKVGSPPYHQSTFSGPETDALVSEAVKK